MSNNIAKITIEKGDEYHPTYMRIQFTPEHINFAFYQGRLERWFGSEADRQKLEVRRAIEACLNLISRELMRAAADQLDIKW